MSLPPSEVPQGAIRFNTDSQRLEFYAQGEWWVMSTDTPNLGQGTDSTPGARGMFAGGFSPNTSTSSNEIQYINIASTGNAQDFGNLLNSTHSPLSNSSSTRGVIGGGNTGSDTNVIQFVTIPSTGNATDFGDLTQTRRNAAGLSNQTRGLFCGGWSSPANYDVIDYITIAQTGNAVDFGNLTLAREFVGTCASPTRGVIMGGATPTLRSVVEFITISTLGNGTEYGELTVAKSFAGGCSNPIRGLYGGGTTNNSPRVRTDAIEYVTIASSGNTTNFGDLTESRDALAACASSIRGVFAGGYAPSMVNGITYVQIMSTGNSVDFGDLTDVVARFPGMSNAHGGL